VAILSITDLDTRVTNLETSGGGGDATFTSVTISGGASNLLSVNVSSVSKFLIGNDGTVTAVKPINLDNNIALKSSATNTLDITDQTNPIFRIGVTPSSFSVANTSGTSITLQAADGNGTNKSGGSIILKGGAPTGSGVRGTVQFPGSGTSSTAIGPSAIASATSAIAIGAATASGNYSISVGYSAAATSGSISIGKTAVCSSVSSVAIGEGSAAQNAYSVSVGYYATSSSSYCVSIGASSSANSQGTAVGCSAVAGSYSVAIGYGANAPGGVAVGNGTAVASVGVALGLGATANGYAAISTGIYASASGYMAIGLGYYTNASGDYSVVLGTAAAGNYSISIGSSASAGQYCVSIGQNALSYGGGISIGSNARSDTVQAIAIGESAQSFSNSLVIGRYAQATVDATGSIVLSNHPTGTNIEPAARIPKSFVVAATPLVVQENENTRKFGPDFQSVYSASSAIVMTSEIDISQTAITNSSANWTVSCDGVTATVTTSPLEHRFSSGQIITFDSNWTDCYSLGSLTVTITDVPSSTTFTFAHTTTFTATETNSSATITPSDFVLTFPTNCVAFPSQVFAICTTFSGTATVEATFRVGVANQDETYISSQSMQPDSLNYKVAATSFATPKGSRTLSVGIKSPGTVTGGYVKVRFGWVIEPLLETQTLVPVSVQLLSPSFTAAGNLYYNDVSLDIISGDTQTTAVYYGFTGDTASVTSGDATLGGGLTNSIIVSPSELISAVYVYAKDTAEGFLDSELAFEGPFTFKVATPSFNANPGPDLGSDYSVSPAVTISSDTTSASFKYTIDGSDPAAFGMSVSSGVPINIPMNATGTQLRALAEKSYYATSDEQTATYTFALPQPSISYPYGITNSLANSLAFIPTSGITTAGVSMYYSLDGSTPTTLVGDGNTIYVYENATVRLINYGQSSGIKSASVGETLAYLVDAPTFVVSSGASFSSAIDVGLTFQSWFPNFSVSCAYTTDGTDPIPNSSPLAPNPLVLDGGTTGVNNSELGLKVVTYTPGKNTTPSPVTSLNISFRCTAPGISMSSLANSGIYVFVTGITGDDLQYGVSLAGQSLFYATYSGPVFIDYSGTGPYSNGATFFAKAIRPNYIDSSGVSSALPVIPSAPTINVSFDETSAVYSVDITGGTNIYYYDSYGSTYFVPYYGTLTYSGDNRLYDITVQAFSSGTFISPTAQATLPPRSITPTISATLSGNTGYDVTFAGGSNTIYYQFFGDTSWPGNISWGSVTSGSTVFAIGSSGSMPLVQAYSQNPLGISGSIAELYLTSFNLPPTFSYDTGMITLLDGNWYLTGASFYYGINTYSGPWTVYTVPFAVNPGDAVYAYAFSPYANDSGISSYMVA
jgi:hypothetical protein